MAAFAGPDIEKNLPEAMAMAAFAGISFYIGAEINLSLFLLFKRRRGLYFWACALCSWGVILQPLFILLADFGVWTELRSSITMIYATWLIMVVPQSWILYSRLHLIMRETAALRWIKIVLIFTSIALSVPTTVAGILAQAVLSDAKFIAGYSIWDRFEVAGFFVQETLLSLLYIYKTHKHLRDVTVLSRSRHFVDPPPGGPGGNGGGGAQQGDDADADADKDDDDDREVLQLMCHLIGSNVLVIALDAALLGIQFAELFYLQGAFKPCVYGVKLKVEFAILNRLVESVRARGAGFDQELDHQDRHHHHYGGRGVSPSSSQAYVSHGSSRWGQ
ncbi:hypothetical protein GGR56DRAFT_665323 [Xylariaceae sp. FL0804]|nr:hypothetical protein GGR56DRAFT_665323 [Xylariaceae sp. FL0804]